MTPREKPYTIYCVDGAPRTRRWPKVALVVMAIVIGIAGVGAATAYIWLDRLMRRMHDDPSVSAAISVLTLTTSSGAGAAGGTTGPPPKLPGTMDIVVFGSDNRDEGDGIEEYGRSDTIMLVHVDPRANFVSVLSLPRDLRVEIPGHGIQKLNAAYSYGGPALAIETIQNLTGIDLDHFVNIDFDAFRQVTISLGGVWIDVDRRYYHQTQAGDAEYHENLDIQAGYQRLMGEDALDFVRYRIDANSDFGRMQRQQLFLREAKRQLVSFATALQVPKLAGLVADNVKTSLLTGDVIDLAFWGLRLDGSRVKQISLEGDAQQIDGIWYVLATDSQLREAVSSYRTAPLDEALQEGTDSTGSGSGDTGTSSGGTSETSAEAVSSAAVAGVKVEVLNGNGRTGQAATAASMLRAVGAEVVAVGDAPARQEETTVLYPSGRQSAAEAVTSVLGTGGTVLDSGASVIKVILGYDFQAEYNRVTSPGPSGIIYEDEYKALQSMVSFNLLGPTYIPPYYRYNDRRVYEIDAGGGSTFPAVKTIYRLGREDQYLGIMQTTFLNAPIASAGQTVEIDGVTYTIVGISGTTDHIWWKKGGVLYWVSNTLSHLLTREELLRVASGMTPVL